MLNVSGFARMTNDGIQSVRVPDVIEGVNVLKTTYQNIGMDNSYGSSIFLNISVGKLSLNGGTDIYYSMIDNNNPVDSLRASNEGVVASGRLFGNYDFGKGWGAQFFSFYRGRQVQLQGTQDGFYMYSLGFRKEFNEKRGSVGLAAENFLQPSIKMRTQVESPLVRQTRINTRDNLSFRVTFSYRIGKMSVEQRPARRRRTINNDDLKEGGGDGGMQMGGGNEGTAPQGGGRQEGARQRPTAPAQRIAPALQGSTNPSDSSVREAAGLWYYTIDSPQTAGGIITLNKEGKSYTGTIRNDRRPDPMKLEDVSVEGDEVAFHYFMTFGANPVKVTVNARISNGVMHGTMTMGENRTFNLSAKKTQ